MAGKNYPQAPDEAVDSPRANSGRATENSEALDDRFSDMEAEPESPFLRAQKRVPVRRGALPSKKAANRVKVVLTILGVLAILALVWWALHSYATKSERFRIESSDSIEVTGNEHISRLDIIRVFGDDISRNVFFVPLAERKKQLEALPWVETATVMRLLPNRLSVKLQERTPVAFAQVGARIQLIDAQGVLMELTPGTQQKYSFPVIVGMNETEPLSTRAARMKIYRELVREIDAEGSGNSQTLSEVDVTDPEDVRARIDDPAGAVLVHLGKENFGERYRLFLGHLQEWRQQYPRMESVDLRYGNSVILNPETKAEAPEPPKAVSKPAVPAKKPAAKPAAAKNARGKKR